VQNDDDKEDEDDNNNNDDDDIDIIINNKNIKVFYGTSSKTHKSQNGQKFC
jgi:hypothetical protein